MQRDEHVDPCRCGGADVTDGEFQVGAVAFARDPIGQIDQIGAALDALHHGLGAEQRGDGEGEVTLAATHVGDPPRAVRRQMGFRRQMVNEFGELLDLAEFRRHALTGLATIVGDTEGAQPGQMRIKRMLPGAVVGLGLGPGLHGFAAQPRGSVRLEFQLHLPGGGEEMGIEKRVCEQTGDFPGRGIRRVILGYIARAMAVNETELRTGLQPDRAHVDIAQIGVGCAGLAEGHFAEGAVGQRGPQQFVKA